MHRGQSQNNHKNNNHYKDPFGMGDNFGFDIREDFDDPFEGMMGGFGFPNLGQIHQRLFGNIERAFQGFGRLGDGNERTNNRGHQNQNQNGLQRAGTNNFQGFFSMQGVGPSTVISKSSSLIPLKILCSSCAPVFMFLCLICFIPLSSNNL